MSEHILTHKHQTHKHQAHNHAASDWRIHCGIEVTELSTNKQHTLSHTGGDRAGDGGVRDGRLRMATLINGRDADRSTDSAFMRHAPPLITSWPCIPILCSLRTPSSHIHVPLSKF